MLVRTSFRKLREKNNRTRPNGYYVIGQHLHLYMVSDMVIASSAWKHIINVRARLCAQVIFMASIMHVLSGRQLFKRHFHQTVMLITASV